jgi:hypothetical protein
MSKAIEGAAMIAGAVAVGVAEFALASTGVGIAALPFLTGAMMALAAGGVAMEAGAIASALTTNRGMNITTRQPAAPRQIIYGQQRVGGVYIYESTTGSGPSQFNYVIALAGHACSDIQALYLDGRKVWFNGSGAGWTVQNGVGFGGAANGNTYTGPDGTQYNFGNLVFANAYYGDQTAADLDVNLQANDSTWGPSSSGTPYLGGCTWMYLKCEYYTSIFPNAPEVRVTVDGKPVYDPRTGVTAFSANSALVIADWLQDTVYGMGMAVNEEQLIAAANMCDEQVALAAGGYESMYQCHYHFDTSTAPSDALATMLKSCGGRISVIGGEVYIWPAYWQGPSASFDESMLTAPLQWDPTAAYKDNCNFVTGTYTAPNYPYNVAGNLFDSNGFDPEGNLQNNFQFGFQPTSFPPYAQDPLHGYAANQWLDEDSNVSGPWSATTAYAAGTVVAYVTDIAVGTSTIPYYSVYKSLAGSNPNNVPSPTSTVWQLAGINLPLEVSYNMVLSIAQAQRLAKIDLLRRRFWGRGQLEMGLPALSMQEIDVMYFTFPLHGWSEKILEITGCTVKVSGGDGSPGAPGKPSEIRVQFDVAETDPSIYEWSATEELTIYDVPGVMQSPSRLPVAPTGLTVISSSATALVAADGIVTPRLEVTWDTPLDSFATGIQIQYQQGGSGTWQDGGTPSVEVNQAFIGPIVAGQEYSVQIRTVRASGATSAWEGPVTITGGLVLSIVSQAGVGIGSLSAAALSSTTAAIICSGFQTYIGQILIILFPAGAVTLLVDGTIGGAGGDLALQTRYYVYYSDPNFLGGNVTPIATTTMADFIGKPGYFLIDSIVTPAYSSGSGSARIAPTTFSDTGSYTTIAAYQAFDGNLATSATVSGMATDNGTTSGYAYGDCTFLGFPATSSTSDRTLSVILSASMNIARGGANGTISLTVSISGTVTTLATLTANTASATYTADIPAGTNIGTVSIQVIAIPGAVGTPITRGTTEQSNPAANVFEIYIQ